MISIVVEEVNHSLGFNSMNKLADYHETDPLVVIVKVSSTPLPQPGASFSGSGIEAAMDNLMYPLETAIHHQKEVTWQ